MRELEIWGSFKPYLNPLGAWALAFGCSIGWGAFFIPSTFLPESGIAGSIAGVVIGALIMIVIARNYRTMIAQHPKAGGAFDFASRTLGHDHGYLCGWFLCLMYLGLIWANISAFALLVRYTFGGAFEGHHLYAIAGFDIYAEEVGVCMFALCLAGGICIYRKKLAQYAQIVFALVLAIGLIVLFVLVTGASAPAAHVEPLFVPGVDPAFQVFATISVIPWAYVGFESISHSAEEFSFSPSKSFGVMAAAIVMAGLAYVFMIVISVVAIPAGYPDWVAYVNDLGSLSGFAAMPTFSAINLALGPSGIALLVVTLLGALFSSLVGCIICLSRLVCVMAKNGIFPVKLAMRTDEGIPRNAILAIVGISVLIPFLGRTAISWNVDISNIGATIAYGYTSFCAFRFSKVAEDKPARIFGIVGVVLSVFFLALMLLPSNALAQESYLIFTLWVIAGLLLNYSAFKRDREQRYGRSPIVWVALFVLTLYASASFVWQSSLTDTQYATETIQAHYAVEAPANDSASDGFVVDTMTSYRNKQMNNYLVTLVLIVTAFGIIVANYAIMKNREMESAKELGEARAKAFTDKLTGVKSVNAYRDREREIDEAIQSGAMTPFALAICDVNDVKEVNDHYGHQAGDDYIRTGSAVICKVFDHSPVYRIGGDEFVVLLSGSDYAIRDQLRRQFDDINAAHLKTGEIKIAVGISDWQEGKDKSVADVFARADIVMYKCKSELKAQRRA